MFGFPESEGSGTEVSAEQEARRIIKKIRRQVLLLNRKWAEINQRSNEWQHRIDETLEVSRQYFLSHHSEPFTVRSKCIKQYCLIHGTHVLAFE